MNSTPVHTRWDELKQRLQQTTLAMQTTASRDGQRRDEIFRQRAARLAEPADQENRNGDTTRTLLFGLGDQQFGISLKHVQQVYPMRPLTPVPHAPAFVLGIASFETQIRSVIDLRELLNPSYERSEQEERGRNILLLHDSGGAVAVQVDRVEEIQNIDLAQLSAPDQPLDRASFVLGVTPEHVIILSAEAFITYFQSMHGSQV